MTDLSRADATTHAELIRSGELSPLEAVDAAIERIEQLNPKLNAVIWTGFEQARQAATAQSLPDGPLRGVPFLIKDIGATQAGLPHWLGNRVLKEMNHQSDGDSELGARFRQAGLITLGKTNLPELGSSPSTQPLSCGPTNNPWDLTRSPAGSSGGSAAAVASGMVPLAHANDGGGSTRLPAAWCGLVGLKTTRGRVPNPLNVSRLLSELVVSRTVRDTATVLDAVQGSTAADLYNWPAPDRPYVEELGAPTGPLKVAMISDGGPYPLDPECAIAVQNTGAQLEALGHRIEPVSSDILFGGDASLNGRLWMGGIARRVALLGEMAGRPLTHDEVDPYNWTAAQRGATITASEWAAATEQQQQWSVSLVNWMSQYDIVITPTAGCRPLTTAELEPPADKPWKISSTYALIGAFTLPFNVTGQPAISLPLHQTPQGLPIGVQLVASMGRDDLLIRLASTLEQQMPWADRAISPQV